VVDHQRSVPWRWATAPTPGRRHYGNKIGMLAAAMGRAPMPWQRDIARVATELDPDTGEWAYSTVVIHIQRQAGKTTLMIPSNLHECLRNPDSYCWYTAQTRQAARDNFLRDVKPLIRSRISALVKLRKANGSEGLEIKANGSEYRVFSPGSEELHGKTNRRVTVDEAWAFDWLAGLELMQGIIPTFTTTAGQVWIQSTAGTAESEFFLDWIVKGRAAVEAGRNTDIAYFECSIPPDSDPQDLAKPHMRESFLKLVLDNHPAYGHTLKVSAARAALLQLDPGEFARAYGNFWTPDAELPVLSASDYTTCTDKRPPQLWAMPVPGAVALGFDVSEDDADHAIVAAWIDPDTGTLTLSVVAVEAGVAGLIPRLVDLIDEWEPVGIGYNDYGPAAAAGDEARRAGLPVTGLTGQKYATACAALKSAIGRHAVTIQPDPALTGAVSGLSRRNLGEAWKWDRRASGKSIATVVGATVAKWTLEHAGPAFEVN
jgi:hypothetical protein